MLTMLILGLTLVVLAGLNAPLSVVALWMAAAAAPIVLRHELAWIASPSAIWLAVGTLALQFLADLYFVPATVRDRAYVGEDRVVNAFLHARFQSFFRPLVAGLVFAALPTPASTQMAAAAGFLLGTAIYWGSAWVREQVAISRGSVILLIVEVLKNILALGAAVLVTLSPSVALVLIGGALVPLALWAARLHREQSLYPAYGGRIAPEDS